MYLESARPIVGRRANIALPIDDWGLGDITFADLAPEMAGQEFRTAAAFTSGGATIPAGQSVRVIVWANAPPTVLVRVPAPAPAQLAGVVVPKSLLRPILTPVPGIAPYEVGLDRVIRDHTLGAAAIASWQARRAQHRTPRAIQLFEAQLRNLQDLQANRDRLLDKRLIQAVMFNRFDALIRGWTDFYNARFPFTGADLLDPNIVKAMLFQESQVGTAGRHLEASPTFLVRSRFNIGQVIDSSASALLLMMEEIDSGLIARHALQNIRRDVDGAKRDLAALPRLRSRTSAQEARLSMLRGILAQSRVAGISFPETFMWQYRAPGHPTSFDNAVFEFFTSVPAGSPHRHLDYSFWIRTAIRWLFAKRRAVSSWSEAVRAFNGSGPRAVRYRDRVLQRASAATAAQRASRALVPAGI